MSTRRRAKPGQGIPPETKQDEGKRLHALWKARHRLTQAEFAAECGFSPGYLPQFFGGLRPLTLELAERFAAELNVDVSDFSPRLAAEQAQAASRSIWPFRRVTREQYALLSIGQRFEIESKILRELVDSGHITEKALRLIG